MNTQQQNFVSRVLALANELREIRRRIDDLEEQWFGNGHNVNIREVDKVFPALTDAQLTALMVALLAVRDTLVTQKNNLVKAVE